MSAYAYLSGVIKYRETKLLNSTDIERMADAKDADTAFKVFNDTDYADNLLAVDTNNFQEALDDDLKQVKELFKKHLNSEFIKLLFIAYDGHNIKLLLKANHTNQNLDKFISKLGIENPKKIKDYINTTDSVKNFKIDSDIKTIIDKTKKIVGNRPFPHRIDYIVDREIFHISYHISKKLKNKYLLELTKLQIDLANLKIFIRSKLMEKPYEFVEKKFIKYGEINIEELKKLYNDRLKDSLKYFQKYFNHKKLNEALNYFEKDNNNLTKFEKATEDIEMDFIRKTKKVAYGQEVPAGYFYAKNNAMKTARAIITGKLNHIENDEIKERLRELY